MRCGLAQNSNKNIAVVCDSDRQERHDYAQQLASQLSLPVAASINSEFTYALVVTEQQLELRQTVGRSKPLFVDFSSPVLNYRLREGGGKNQLLAKAVGVKGAYRPEILDATAGLGTDGFILACLGCKVHWLERSPIVAVLLRDGLARFQRQHPDAELALKLTVADAISYLNTQPSPPSPDVIYLDPMFPERSKAALGKQTMRILHQLAGADEDAHLLLEAALHHTKNRVVVKRPRLAPVIPGRKPDIVFTGKSSRFDVYLCAYTSKA